jgi:hypothetical protein
MIIYPGLVNGPSLDRAGQYFFGSARSTRAAGGIVKLMLFSIHFKKKDGKKMRFCILQSNGWTRVPGRYVISFIVLSLARS